MDYTNTFGSAYIDIGSLYPIEYVSITGTGTMGTIDPNATGDYSNTRNSGCVTLADGLGNTIRTITGDCFDVSTLSSATVTKIKNLVPKMVDGYYHIQMVLPSTALDKNYILTTFDFGHYVDQFTEEWVCKNIDTGVINTPGGPITDQYNELTGSGDVQRAILGSGTITGGLGFSFGTLASVSSGANCSTIYDPNT